MPAHNQSREVAIIGTIRDWRGWVVSADSQPWQGRRVCRAWHVISELGCERRLTISKGCERSGGSADDFRLCL